MTSHIFTSIISKNNCEKVMINTYRVSVLICPINVMVHHGTHEEYDSFEVPSVQLMGKRG